MELISVIVPVYNIEKYITRCVESILQQTYENLQIILVNDGSTDNSGKVCDELALRDKRVEVYHKENGGASSARNVGLEKASGKYIGFVDGDDYIEKDMYAVLYAEAKRHRADMVSCGYYEEFDDKINVMCYNEEIMVLDKIEAYEALFSNKAIIGCSCCNKLFKRNVIENKRYKEGIEGEDLELMYRLLDGMKKIVSVNEIKYHYVHRADSVTMTSFKKKNVVIVDILEEMVTFIKQNYEEVVLQAYAYQLKWLIEGIGAILMSPAKRELKEEKRTFDTTIRKNFKFYWKNPYVNLENYVLFWANLFQMYVPALWMLKNGTRFYHFLRGNK